MTSPRGGTSIRLIPMGDGYRYAGRGVWFDGKYAKATLYFGPRSNGTACDVVAGPASGRVVVAAY